MSSTNPKDIAGSSKPPLALIPPIAEIYTSEVLRHGADKYGAWNWRRERIGMTAYLSAMRRHINAVIAGEDIDRDSGLPHLAHVMATAAIVMDAAHANCVIDDRPTGESFQG